MLMWNGFMRTIMNPTKAQEKFCAFSFTMHSNNNF
jgi:hypothetical protein